MADLDASHPATGTRPEVARPSLHARARLAVLAAMLTAGAGATLVFPAAGAAPGAMALAGMGLAGIVVLRGLGTGYPHRRFGPANVITLARASGVAVLAGALAVPGASEQERWALTTLAALILALDGLDGWAARRSGLVSDYGARFDLEVDSAFALVLALLVWQAGTLGAWVIVLGLFRPAFLLAGRLWPPLAAPLPGATWRKTVCVIQLAALAALLSPALPAPLAPAVALAVLAMLLASFARDAVWLARAARR